ncbi:hypothetical protein [Corynebacterium mayonis]|uniref:hypothetical protein n=1 Tax=Corynebacterium mayonis TaxID=3062461 RepID=UPI0031401305
MNPLAQIIAQLHDARYIEVADHNSYINLVEDLATELAWHLRTLGVEWPDIAREIEASPIPQLATFEMGVTSAIRDLTPWWWTR